MTTRTCATTLALSLFATAVSAESPPPAGGKRSEVALEAFVAEVGVDLSQKGVLADLAAIPRIRLPEIQACLGDFDPHDARAPHEGHSDDPFE